MIKNFHLFEQQQQLKREDGIEIDFYFYLQEYFRGDVNKLVEYLNKEFKGKPVFLILSTIYNNSGKGYIVNRFEKLDIGGNRINIILTDGNNVCAFGIIVFDKFKIPKPSKRHLNLEDDPWGEEYWYD